MTRPMEFSLDHFLPNDDMDWPWMMTYREAALRMALRWLRRRSQRGKMRYTTFYTEYIARHPIAHPRRLVNLFA